MKLQAYDRPLEMMTSFKYRENVLSTYDNNWKLVVANIWKAWRK